MWPWSRGVPQNFGVSFDIFATAKASDFKFGTHLGFAKTHHKISPRRKSGVPFSTSATVRASDFGVQLRFARVRHKITYKSKSGRGPGEGQLPKIWRFPFNIHAMAEALSLIHISEPTN